ncbi:uncharacterized protein LAESUDRAFT_731866 [Laetiporus sulphureus 93-53]|uniref:Uncharacterized protein n=1 Tax=Laetiporus sulphureus 93-53 TaxID=1314785 RepID=A0A165BE21_9APHY|nr:uncharacterized protein LAESUDRAFT_731866 [Laetiporus sulphureus 93-53]KZT00846.1 hypothetical protein LAESUDRAFT_731866 [Laetiporus sulphureus 93-53]
MSNFANTTPFASNPLETKDDLARYLVGILDPLAAHTSPGCARIHLGYTGTHYDEAAAQLEGFSRPIWGLASLLAGGGTYDGTQRWLKGFASGANSDHEEFWGNMNDKDQRMVECSAIGFSLAVAKQQLWDPLPPEGKANLETWLGGMNDKEMPNTNWLWFRVFTNLGLSKVGSSKFDAKRMKADLDHLDTFYIGDGWSRDGPEGVVQLDYYSSSFAIQYAQLVYSKLGQQEDPIRCEEFRNRARKFALDFVHYFDPEGRAIPFGRSLTYRFAMSSFWGALAFADVDLPAPLTWGVVKGLQLRNIRFWARQPGAYYMDGTFTIGYCYPNLNMTENYNSPGSPYWCCKSFIALSLPLFHPFWASAEEPYPAVLLNIAKPLCKPFHIACNLGGHTFILSSGQQCSYPVKQSAAKYGKFAYSSAFGYSVPSGSLTLEEHAGDSALSLSEDGGEVWKLRRVTREAHFERGADSRSWLRSLWYPWKDVTVETWLVPPSPGAPLWHLRVHRIRSARALLSAEGAWAIYGQRRDDRALELVSNGSFGTLESDAEARAVSKAGATGIAELGKKVGRTGKVMRTDANTNLMVPRAVMPTLMGEHEASEKDYWLVTGVFGVPSPAGQEGPPAGWEAEWTKRPSIPQEIAALMP